MSTKKIVILPGDGIGPDVIEQAVEVIRIISKKYDINFDIKEALIGGKAIDLTGKPLPAETISLCKEADAVLLGAVGGPKWDNLPRNKRPEAGLLGIRSALGLYANLRPAVIYSSLKDASPLRSDIIKGEIDIMVVRELTGGMYFGQKGRIQVENMGIAAFDTEMYNEVEVERIAKIAFEIAKKRSKRIISVDKANVLESSRLWREVVIKVASDYPEIELSHMYVDNAAMQLVRNPAQFDVLLTSNMFGDILSDEASMITGSIGMLPSASLGIGTLGLYEPIHGSAPDIAGMNKANPIATILSVSLMMNYSFGLENVSKDIENSVKRILDKGYRTIDIASVNTTNIVGTKEMGDLIKAQL